jgi:cation:H+ antiporter
VPTDLLTSHRLDCWEGVVFLTSYVAYSTFLLLAAAEHDILPTLRSVMVQFVVPITVITLLALFVHATSALTGCCRRDVGPV